MNRRSTEVVVSLCLQWDSLPSTRRFYLKHVILGVICAGTNPGANRVVLMLMLTNGAQYARYFQVAQLFFQHQFASDDFASRESRKHCLRFML